MKFERLLETYLAYVPRGYRSFARAMPVWLKQKLWLPREMRKSLGKANNGAFVFTEHHESHAASAFCPSPFEEAAILTFDGVGEWATASFGFGRGNRIQLSHELRFLHSLGLFYTAFTYYTGFKVNSDEYKVMGLAPNGEPRYYDLILEKLIDLKDEWFADQYRHPHESKHSTGEVLQWFDRGKIDFVRGIPSVTLDDTSLVGDGLFTPQRRGRKLDHFLAQSIQVATGSREGVFPMIGRRRAGDAGFL